jgi:hypothetical protein
MLVVLSCETKGDEFKLSGPKENSIIGIIYSDTLSKISQFDIANCITESEFQPLYIGYFLDSIYLNYNQYAVSQIVEDLDSYPSPHEDSLIITVDTTQFIKSLESNGEWEGNEKLEWVYSEVCLKSYPVIIKNLSKQKIMIGYGNYLPLFMEAQDSVGEWKRIQTPYFYGCGYGMTFPFIDKDQILITSCKLFEGNFKTKIRLNYRSYENIYSNEFSANINYSQFSVCSDN